MTRKTPEEKVKRGVKKNVIDAPCQSNINTVVEEHFALETNYCCQTTRKAVASTCFQTVKQSEVIKKVVLREYLS